MTNDVRTGEVFEIEPQWSVLELADDQPGGHIAGLACYGTRRGCDTQRSVSA